MILRFFLIFLLSFSAIADPVSIDFQKMKLVDLVAFVYGQVLNRSYVVDSVVLLDESQVTVNLKKMMPEFIDQEMRRILDAHGYSVDGAAVLHISKHQDDKRFSDSVFVYRPLSRSVAYLLDLSAPLFKSGAFTSQRRGSGINLANVSGGMPQTVGGGGVGALPSIQNSEQGLNASTDRDVDLLVFHGTDKEIDRLKSLLAQVDLPAGEVLVKAVVYEVQTTKKEGSGVDLLASFLNGKLGLTVSGGAAAAVSSAFIKLPFKALDLSAIYSAIDSDDRFKVVTSPRLRVQSGASARFSVGNQTPVLGAVSLDSNGRATQSIEYKPSGVIFDITPTVRQGGTQLKVSQQISQFVPTTTGVNNSPTLNQRQLFTQITARDDEIIVLGGLDENRDSSTDTGLSFLPSWMRSKSGQDAKTEIVLLLTVQRL